MRRFARVAAALAFCATTLPVLAQSFPSRPVTIVVPTAPGGPLDVLARLVQPKLQPLLGQSVIVENKPGAGTYIGGEQVAKSAPDGHSILINASGGLFPDLFMKGLAAQLANELTPVALIGVAHFFFYGPASMPAKDLKEIVALVKANPKKYNLAAFTGALTTLQTRNFLVQQGMDMQAVPFNSAANIITAMLRDEVHLYVGSISAAKPQIDAGKLRAFAKVGEQRSNALPDVASTKELGFEVDINGDYAFFVPRQTPQPVIRSLNEKVRQVVESQDTRASLNKFGFDQISETPEVMAKKFDAMRAALPRMAKDAGVAPQ
jgi:tripartite-type tricarboxylate transporter receptor subunit TctC